MHTLTTTLTHDEETALHNVVARALDSDDTDTAEQARTCWRWLSQVKHQRWEAWKALPDGDPMKEAYREEAGEWSDEDL